MTDSYKDFDGPNPGVRIALLRETTQLTGGGAIAACMMVLTAAIMGLAFFADNSAIRQAAYGAFGTGLIAVFGVFAIIGRRRVYVVYREPPPPT